MNRLERINEHLSRNVQRFELSIQRLDSSNVGTFQYTVPNCGILSKDQRMFYEKNGYLIVPHLLSMDEVNMFNNRFQELASNKHLLPPTCSIMKDIMLVKQGNAMTSMNTITKLQDFYDDDVLFSYAQHKNITKYIESFAGKSFQAIHTMYINKPPDLGKGTSQHPTHQDLHYFPFRPANRIAASWTALEKITRENGCLYVLPGSHATFPLQNHGYSYEENGNETLKNAAYHGIPDSIYDVTKLHYLEMSPGDTVFFHPLLLHGSGPNTSNHFRKAISCHYASSDCEVIDVRGTSQQNLVDEIVELAKKRYRKVTNSDPSEVTIDFKDLWEAKSKLIQ